MTRDLLFIAAMATVGMWLETIGGKRGFLDWFFTPLPLGFSGYVIVILERSM